ncbi:MAG: V-type ATP synthase subunit D [Deltaproteobacteria bacterium]|nr:MAG: V-type ATP synthase subunit D [Deltaproteobacteria bacterium]
MLSLQPTRTNLLLLRERLRIVASCTVILKGRRQVLIRELLQVTRPLMQSRDEIARAYARALGDLAVSAAREGGTALAGLAAASRHELAVEVAECNLLGLHYREVVTHETVARDATARPYDLYGSTPWLEEAIAGFEGIVEEMLVLATFEGKFRRLAEELIRLTRRIRVLEERVAPGLQAEIREMAQYLAERERETHFRLKRFKGYKACAER